MLVVDHQLGLAPLDATDEAGGDGAIQPPAGQALGAAVAGGELAVGDEDDGLMAGAIGGGQTGQWQGEGGEGGARLHAASMTRAREGRN